MPCSNPLHGRRQQSNLQVTDGTNTLASVSLSSQSGFVTENLNYICPSSGYSRIEIEAGADAAVAYIDDAYLGLAQNIENISQFYELGSIQFAPAASCAWTRTGSTSYGTFSADSDCNDPTAYGNATTSAGKIPGGQFTNVPAGTVEVVSSFSLQKTNTADAGVLCRISDGTNTSIGQRYSPRSDTAYVSPMTLVGRFPYTTGQGTLTFQIQCATQDSSNSAIIDAEYAGFQMNVRVFPSEHSIVKPEPIYWKVDANISGGAPSLGTSSVSSYTGLTNSSLTLTNNSGFGSITAQIPCSSTNPPSGTTCSSGDESVGVSFNLPRAGDVLACVSFGNEVSGTTYRAKQIFQIVETPINAQTISQEGKSRVQFESVGTGSAINVGQAFRVCGTFSFSSAGQKALRLFYEQYVETGTIGGSTVLADASATDGQRDIHWEVYPITQALPMPIVLNQVVTPTSGGVRIASARISNSGGTSNCSVTAEDGDWIGTVTESTEGRCVIPFQSGTFSATPSCFATMISSGAEGNIRLNGVSSSQVTIDTINDAGSSLISADFHILCVGAR